MSIFFKYSSAAKNWWGGINLLFETPNDLLLARPSKKLFRIISASFMQNLSEVSGEDMFNFLLLSVFWESDNSEFNVQTQISFDGYSVWRCLEAAQNKLESFGKGNGVWIYSYGFVYFLTISQFLLCLLIFFLTWFKYFDSVLLIKMERVGGWISYQIVKLLNYTYYYLKLRSILNNIQC